MVEKGRYKHYKGNFYLVLGTVKHSETEEELVLYRSESNEQLWVRPLTMFLETVSVNGVEMDRFAYVGEE